MLALFAVADSRDNDGQKYGRHDRGYKNGWKHPSSLLISIH